MLFLVTILNLCDIVPELVDELKEFFNGGLLFPQFVDKLVFLVDELLLLLNELFLLLVVCFSQALIFAKKVE